ncbi:uncharacterized protein LOC106159571 [Lingula anatina]|uniref:Uncharacterized protein LOC106159571 n=1 Tax=Lingula anatina TaxID=7574 RepID=A0A1S3HDY5_LINAN|nr:uncharacterized protein LOC106159571 [Lingula anatina]|eukprot:XP_013391337.1 uncharacterized protein LOC106159571 [Lingula anatina]
MERLYVLILTAALLLAEGYAQIDLIQNVGAALQAARLANTLTKVLSPCSVRDAACKVTNVDVVLALDASGSIDDAEFTSAKDASKIIVETIDISHPILPGGTRVGALKFTRGVVREFELNEHTSLASVKTNIDSIQNGNGLTNIQLALETSQLMIEKDFVEENNELIWLLTDGQSTVGNPIPRATNIKKLGWTICVVAIGNNVNDAEINAIASPDCVFKFGDFAQYVKVATLALNRIQASRAA